MNTFKTKFLQKTVIMGIILVLFIPGIKAQELLTLDKALKYAENNSPDIKQSLLNLTRYQKNLEAQSRITSYNVCYTKLLRIFDERNYALVGRHTHKTFQLGDAIQVKVWRTNLERKQLDFRLSKDEEN